MRSVFPLGPILLTDTYTTNIFNPGTTTGGVNCTSILDKLEVVMRRIRIINKDSADHTFRLFIGATGANTAGTEWIGYDMVVPANDFVEWVGIKLFTTTMFLVGGADAPDVLVLEGDGEIRVGN